MLRGHGVAIKMGRQNLNLRHVSLGPSSFFSCDGVDGTFDLPLPVRYVASTFDCPKYPPWLDFYFRRCVAPPLLQTVTSLSVFPVTIPLSPENA